MGTGVPTPVWGNGIGVGVGAVVGVGPGVWVGAEAGEGVWVGAEAGEGVWVGTEAGNGVWVGVDVGEAAGSAVGVGVGAEVGVASAGPHAAKIVAKMPIKTKPNARFKVFALTFTWSIDAAFRWIMPTRTSGPRRVWCERPAGRGDRWQAWKRRRLLRL